MWGRGFQSWAFKSRNFELSERKRWIAYIQTHVKQNSWRKRDNLIRKATIRDEWIDHYDQKVEKI